MTQCRSVRPPRAVPSTARAERCADCGFADADQQTNFLFRSRDVAVTMNSVKILHAVRSAITAIAELLVLQ